jgi:hypothetical protein
MAAGADLFRSGTSRLGARELTPTAIVTQVNAWPMRQLRAWILPFCLKRSRGILSMHSVFYIIGVMVVVLAILSLLGLN